MELHTTELRVGDRGAVGGLGVYPLLAAGHATGHAYLTGPEAVEAGLLAVDELRPPEVTVVAVSNRADEAVLLVAGEPLVGGAHHRSLDVSVLCPPCSVLALPVSCVDAGRWGVRGPSATPGLRRSADTGGLGARAGGHGSRPVDEGRDRGQVARPPGLDQVAPPARGLDDVGRVLPVRPAHRPDRMAALPDQVGVVCTVGERVVGLDLFDRPSTLARYLGAIVAGHVPQADGIAPGPDRFRTVLRFLAAVPGAVVETGPGRGLGTELHLGGPLTGVGLALGGALVHLAAFPDPARTA